MNLSLNKYINKENIFVFLVLITFLILILLKINSSSIGMYGKYLYGDSSERSLLFESRPIRSDEWLVSTPFIISQFYKNEFDKNFIENYENNLISMLPVPEKNFKVFFHPNMFGYFFMPLEQAFAFGWWINDVILIIFSYLFFMHITKNKILISIIMTLVILFSPFVQWWRGAAISTPGYGFAILYFSIKIFNYKKNKDLIFNSIFLIYFLLCYLFILYPPFQISFAILIIFFLIGYAYKFKNSISKKRLLSFLFVFFFILLTAGIVFVIYFSEFKDIISIIQHTTYPGKRSEIGGNTDWTYLINGSYNIQLLDDAKGSAGWINQSEASNFLLFYPFILPLLIYILIKQIKANKLDYVFLSIIIYLILSTLWLFAEFPFFITKISFLYLVPPKRMLLGIGIADIVLVVYFLSKINIPKGKNFFILSLIASIIAFFVNLLLGFYLLKNYPLFISSNFKIILISLITGFLILTLLLKKTKIFLCVLLAYLIASSYKINPIYEGIDILYSSPLAKKIRDIESTNNSFRWVSYNSNVWGQFIKINGGTSLSGVQLYPQLELWNELDKEKKYSGVWNRYSNVSFEDNEMKSEKMELIGLDAFIVNIDPCNEEMKKLKVKYYLMTSQKKYKCFNEIEKYSIRDGNLYLFERIDY